YVLHFGEVDQEPNPNKAWAMFGDGLVDARQELNDLKKTNRRFSISIPQKRKRQQLNAAFTLFQDYREGWNRPDERELVLQFLKYGDYKYVAQKNGKTRSQIWKREKSLKIEPYNIAKQLIFSISNL
ncbi:MAG: hypothetical protein AAF570_04200, partial [Bacteroidota bacterium]